MTKVSLQNIALKAAAVLRDKTKPLSLSDEDFCMTELIEMLESLGNGHTSPALKEFERHFVPNQKSLSFQKSRYAAEAFALLLIWKAGYSRAKACREAEKISGVHRKTFEEYLPRNEPEHLSRYFKTKHGQAAKLMLEDEYESRLEYGDHRSDSSQKWLQDVWESLKADVQYEMYNHKRQQIRAERLASLGSSS